MYQYSTNLPILFNFNDMNNIVNLSSSSHYQAFPPFKVPNINVNSPEWLSLVSHKKALQVDLNATAKLLADDKPLYFQETDYLFDTALYGTEKNMYTAATVTATFLAIMSCIVGALACVRTHALQKHLLSLTLAANSPAAHAALTNCHSLDSENSYYSTIFNVIAAFILSLFVVLIVHLLWRLWSRTSLYHGLYFYWQRLFTPQDSSHIILELTSLHDTVRLPVVTLKNAPSHLFFPHEYPCRILTLKPAVLSSKLSLQWSTLYFSIDDNYITQVPLPDYISMYTIWSC